MIQNKMIKNKKILRMKYRMSNKKWNKFNNKMLISF